MGFHGYGGSEMDHSECFTSPCSACRKSLLPAPLSVRSGNTYSNPSNNQNHRGTRANVFGDEYNVDTARSSPTTAADTAAENTGNLSETFHQLSITDEEREEGLQSQFRVPSVSGDPALCHPLGTQNRDGYSGFQSQNQSKPGDGIFRLTVENRTSRDEMRKSGFRIPSVSGDPALSRPDDRQNHPDYVGLQGQKYQADNKDPGAATGSPYPGSSAATGHYSSSCAERQSDSDEMCDVDMHGNVPGSYDDMAPWAAKHPTTKKTLRRVLENKQRASYGRSQKTAGNRQTSTVAETSPQGQTGHPRSVAMARSARLDTRMDEFRMQLDGCYDLEQANEQRNLGPEWQNARQG
ncbi:hypothetical protein V490_05441 [Pseudogymnoascus sp. VKM F-3557]|nr:hypothetical protein V490_05441 [Pseudogymnoascus sp. VKM F-3557]